ncbi:MAG: hypothetical protein Q4F51_10800, partial [Sarcina sp.]|nr:hypothetical protein [Sarcina sp.]
YITYLPNALRLNVAYLLNYIEALLKDLLKLILKKAHCPKVMSAVVSLAFGRIQDHPGHAIF